MPYGNQSRYPHCIQQKHADRSKRYDQERSWQAQYSPLKEAIRG